MNCLLNVLRQKQQCQRGDKGEDGKTGDRVSEQGRPVGLCWFASVSSHKLLESDQVAKGKN